MVGLKHLHLLFSKVLFEKRLKKNRKELANPTLKQRLRSVANPGGMRGIQHGIQQFFDRKKYH